MSFREDREAQTERIAQLERELEVAQRTAAQNAKAAANEVTLRRQIDMLTLERDRLVLGIAPLARGLRLRFALFAATVLIGTGVFVYFQQQEHMAELQACAAALRASEGEAASAHEDAARAAQDLIREARQEQESAERDADRVRLELARPDPRPEPLPVGVFTTGVVHAHSGTIAVRDGDPCTVDVAYQAATRDCHATISCGATPIYARGGGGFFDCDVVDGRVVSGRDVNPTPLSRDPQLGLDVAGRNVTVMDTEPDWSVTIGWGP